MVKSLMSESDVQEIGIQPCLIVLFNILPCSVMFYFCSIVHFKFKGCVSFQSSQRGIQDFQMDYVLVPADEAASDVVVVWRLYNINTLKRELVDTNAYKLQPSLSERVIVDGHGCHTALYFDVKAN